MRWPQASIRDIAPPERAAVSFNDEQEVWSLSLDQIESQTGRILGKQRIRAGDAGTSTFPFDTEHVLYSKLRPYLNKVVRPDEPGLATTELVPLRPNRDLIDAGFLTFYLRSDSFLRFATNMVAGAKMPRMVMDRFWEHLLPLPPLSEQRRIVELLEQADTLRRHSADADSLAKRVLPALFRKMFGDPVRNPKQWPLKRFDALGEARLGKMLDGNRQTGLHRRKYLRNLNLQWDRFELANLLEMDFFPEEREEFKLIRGDLLICEGGEVGRAAIWDEQLKECYFQKALHRVRPYKGEATSEFLLYWLWEMAKQQALVSLNSKATIAHLTGVQLAALKVIAPPYPMMEQFTTLVRTSKLISNKQKAARDTIETLFQTLLHRAFTGELTAGWREAHMKELLAEMEIQARHLASVQA